MKVIIQRVTQACCVVDNKITGQIEQGLMLLIGFGVSDENIKKETLLKMGKKIANLRIFSDDTGKMNLSIQNIGGKVLAISQFTLYANPYDGNRPSFTEACNPTQANELYLEFLEILEKEYHLIVEKGIFQKDMQINMTCDGPVTITLEY